MIMERIKRLPQYVQDIIWSFNVEGHRGSMKKVLSELNENQSAYCMRCMKAFYIKDLIDIDQMQSFSAEYFFKKYEICYNYGLICCSESCKRQCITSRYTSRFLDTAAYRRSYYRRRAYRLELEFDDDDDDDDVDYY
jgi:hypothetical protein